MASELVSASSMLDLSAQAELEEKAAAEAAAAAAADAAAAAMACVHFCHGAVAAATARAASACAQGACALADRLIVLCDQAERNAVLERQRQLDAAIAKERALEAEAARAEVLRLLGVLLETSTLLRCYRYIERRVFDALGHDGIERQLEDPTRFVLTKASQLEREIILNRAEPVWRNVPVCRAIYRKMEQTEESMPDYEPYKSKKARALQLYRDELEALTPKQVLHSFKTRTAECAAVVKGEKGMLGWRNARDVLEAMVLDQGWRARLALFVRRGGLLAELVPHLDARTALVLHDHDISQASRYGLDGAFFFAAFVQRNRSLCTVSLRRCRIGPEELGVLCAGLRTNCTVRELDLAENELGPEGLLVLRGLLRMSGELYDWLGTRIETADAHGCPPWWQVLNDGERFTVLPPQDAMKGAAPLGESAYPPSVVRKMRIGGPRGAKRAGGIALVDRCLDGGGAHAQAEDRSDASVPNWLEKVRHARAAGARLVIVANADRTAEGSVMSRREAEEAARAEAEEAKEQARQGTTGQDTASGANTRLGVHRQPIGRGLFRFHVPAPQGPAFVMISCEQGWNLKTWSRRPLRDRIAEWDADRFEEEQEKSEDAQRKLDKKAQKNLKRTAAQKERAKQQDADWKAKKKARQAKLKARITERPPPQQLRFERVGNTTLRRINIAKNGALVHDWFPDATAVQLLCASLEHNHSVTEIVFGESEAPLPVRALRGLMPGFPLDKPEEPVCAKTAAGGQGEDEHEAKGDGKNDEPQVEAEGGIESAGEDEQKSEAKPEIADEQKGESDQNDATRGEDVVVYGQGAKPSDRDEEADQVSDVETSEELANAQGKNQGQDQEEGKEERELNEVKTEDKDHSEAQGGQKGGGTDERTEPPPVTSPRKAKVKSGGAVGRWAQIPYVHPPTPVSAHAAGLVSLTLSGQGLRAIDGVVIGSLLRFNSLCTALDLSNNPLGGGYNGNFDATGFEAIADALAGGSLGHDAKGKTNMTPGVQLKGGTAPYQLNLLGITLTHLDLHSCRAGTRGAKAIAAALAVNATLTTLDLRDNDISDKGAVHIGAGLASNRVLARLDLRGNTVQDAKGGAALARAFCIGRSVSNRGLMWLNGLTIHGAAYADLSNYYPSGGLSNYEVAFIARQLQRVAFRDKMSGDRVGSGAGAEVVRDCSRAWEQGRTLQRIDLRYNRIDPQQVEKIKAICTLRDVHVDIADQGFFCL